MGWFITHMWDSLKNAQNDAIVKNFTKSTFLKNGGNGLKPDVFIGQGIPNLFLISVNISGIFVYHHSIGIMTDDLLFNESLWNNSRKN